MDIMEKVNQFTAKSHTLEEYKAMADEIKEACGNYMMCMCPAMFVYFAAENELNENELNELNAYYSELNI